MPLIYLEHHPGMGSKPIVTLDNVVLKSVMDIKIQLNADTGYSVVIRKLEHESDDLKLWNKVEEPGWDETGALVRLEQEFRLIPSDLLISARGVVGGGG